MFRNVPGEATLKAAGGERVLAEKVIRGCNREEGAGEGDCRARGDVLLITRLDRLARSTRDLLKSRGQAFV
jgi:hypothetical protein